MKLTIIKDDGVVAVDGVFRAVDLSELPAPIRAVQWDGEEGHVEFYGGIPNAEIDTVEMFQAFIELWEDAAPPPPTPPTPAENKVAALARINSDYELAISALTAGYPVSEVMTWPQQLAEARAWLADNEAPSPWLRGAAKGGRISVENLARRIIRNAQEMAPAYGELTGRRGDLVKAIEALGDSPTLEQLDAIQW